MGGHPYYYFVPYQADLPGALDALRKREFEAGRYHPVTMFPEMAGSGDSPGKGHRSIDEARNAAAEEGTRSILDLDHIAEEPEFCAASPVPPEQLEELFGTRKPTREEFNLEILGEVERGHGIYVVLYRDGAPDEIFFGGYSFD